MATQSNVFEFQTPGMPGDFYDNSAQFTHGAIVTSGGVIGNAATYVDAATDPRRVQGGGSGLFAGIIVNGKELIRANGLSAGLTLASESIAPVCEMGNIWVKVETAVQPGYVAAFDSSTGAIGGYATSAAATSGGKVVIPGGEFVITTASSGGMAVLRLTK